MDGYAVCTQPVARYAQRTLSRLVGYDNERGKSDHRPMGDVRNRIGLYRQSS
jgi:hypothetical protein